MKTIEQIFEQQNPQDGKLPEWTKKLVKEYAKQLLEEYTNRIIENVKTTTHEEYIPQRGEYEYTQIVKKESITSQLPKFLKEKGL